MDLPLHITVLGSGTSTGVPTIGCRCEVCTSPDPRDNRLRPSILVRYAGRGILIDTTPDFREQALRENITQLDAVLYTHAGPEIGVARRRYARPSNASMRFCIRTRMPITFWAWTTCGRSTTGSVRRFQFMPVRARWTQCGACFATRLNPNRRRRRFPG